MKRILQGMIVLVLILTLSGCFMIREKLKEAPDEVTIPSYAKVAICVEDEVTHKYIYYLDGVYAYYIDDIKQSEEIIDDLLEQAYLHGQSMENYLDTVYGVAGCEIEDYPED